VRRAVAGDKEQWNAVFDAAPLLIIGFGRGETFPIDASPLMPKYRGERKAA
jgi:hypothetical protein